MLEKIKQRLEKGKQKKFVESEEEKNKRYAEESLASCARNTNCTDYLTEALCLSMNEKDFSMVYDNRKQKLSMPNYRFIINISGVVYQVTVRGNKDDLYAENVYVRFLGKDGRFHAISRLHYASLRYISIVEDGCSIDLKTGAKSSGSAIQDGCQQYYDKGENYSYCIDMNGNDIKGTKPEKLIKEIEDLLEKIQTAYEKQISSTKTIN